MVWPVQTHPAQSTGPESKRNSGDGEYFSLDFSFYRTALPEEFSRQSSILRGAKMSLLRSTIGLTTMAVALLLAQSPERTRAKEAALKNSLFTLWDAIDKYTEDQHKAPKTLQDLIAKGYVASIPTDPMTGSSSTWRVVMEDPAGRDFIPADDQNEFQAIIDTPVDFFTGWHGGRGPGIDCEVRKDSGGCFRLSEYRRKGKPLPHLPSAHAFRGT